ncbi:hypothetical protein BPTFM16_00790 [Altererythrobacter insulae]|nr:hypothetical protein BPTFM16_00790 [Altererythrobacter insulae]
MSACETIADVAAHEYTELPDRNTRFGHRTHIREITLALNARFISLLALPAISNLLFIYSEA